MPDGNPPWNFGSISRRPKVTGPWMVEVKKACRYRITLRQLPQEADKPVIAVKAKIEMAGQTLEQPVKPGSRGVVFETDLPAGPTELWTCLYEENDLTCGFIKLQPHRDMPFYSHPGLNSMCLVLSGHIEAKHYTMKRSHDKVHVTQTEEQTDNQTKFSLISYHGASEGDAIYCQSDTNSLTNLGTGDQECLLLNLQLSRHY